MPGREVFGQEEIQEVVEVLQRGVLFRYGFDAQRQGIFKVAQFEKEFANFVGSKYALGVSSGTSALKTALEGLNLPRKTEVLTPCFTFVATIESIEEAGLKPVLCEIDESLNISVEDMQAQLSKKTSAILPVHMMGSSCDMESIMAISGSANVPVVEDTCQATGAQYKGKKLGTFGKYGCFSFDYVKVLTTGEGGMVVTDDENLYQQADWYHDHGHPHRKDLPRGVEERMRKGTNFRMNEIQGALGIVQLRKLPSIIEAHKKNKAIIKQALEKYDFISFRKHFDSEGEIATFLAFFLPDAKRAEKFKEKMKANGINPGILNYWHFFANIQSVKTKRSFIKSRKILEKTVVIEILVKMEAEKIADTLDKICREF
ncbi:MAG: DegT/DnrJ/EryC1/StrS family aminotransferase [Candidatus Omnitrophica bacterium]|nr:DegT/DnrJ/EryC1/StrS family aminotransferase [Candidatus Omnitrophota bacterium]